MVDEVAQLRPAERDVGDLPVEAEAPGEVGALGLAVERVDEVGDGVDIPVGAGEIVGDEVARLAAERRGDLRGGHVVRAARVMHGKTDAVTHIDAGVFGDVPSPFTVTRYHSLAIERASLPECLEVTAWTDDGEIMGVRHRTLDVEGVQFHPESILSEHGHRLLKNFLAH